MPTSQHPLNTGYTARTTAQEVLLGTGLTGKVAVVTGGYSGIGVETTRALSAAGATVIAPARSRAKAERNLSGIDNVEIEQLDLTDPDSVDGFAKSVVDSGRPVHMLINSAGVMMTPLQRDSRGHEMQFSANHLGHFQLTTRLWPALRRAGGARVVSVSSQGHRLSGVDFDDPDYERRPYDKVESYAQSKTANVLFALELDRRGEADGVRAFSVHPGSIPTDLNRHLSDQELNAYGMSRNTGGGYTVARREGQDFKTPQQGAATSVWCATGAALDGLGGVYCRDCDIVEVVAADAPGLMGVASYAVDPALASRLWELSENLTGASIPA